MKKRKIYTTVKLDIRFLAFFLITISLLMTVVFQVDATEIFKSDLTQAGPQADTVRIPIVMYHSLLKDPSKQGEYVVSPDQFEEDLQYLLDNGYTTVLVQDLIDYTQGGTLPEKPVMITFDDGNYNNYYYGFAIARQLNCKFIISPIGYYTDTYSEAQEENPNYSHATWERLREMSESGLVEVQNHTYNLHKDDGGRKGVKKLWGESEEEYRTIIMQDVGLAQDKIEENVGKRPTAFAYPFGAVTQSTPQVMKDLGFAATLTSRELVSEITRDPESLYDLGRFVRPSGIGTVEFFQERMQLNGE